MNPRLKDRHGVLRRLGSFWYRNTSPKTQDLARHILSWSWSTTGPQALDQAAANLLGSDTEVHEHLSVVFDPGDVTQVGADIQARVLTKLGDADRADLIIRRPGAYDNDMKGHVLLGADSTEETFISTEVGDLLLVPTDPGAGSVVIRSQDLFPFWVLPFPDRIPLMITTVGKDLLLGLDYVWSHGNLIFQTPPQSLFRDGRIRCKAVQQKKRSLFSYPWGSDRLYGTRGYIPQYLKGNGSVTSFKLAVAEAAGFHVLPKDDVLLESTQEPQGVRYRFENNSVLVSYPHRPLSVGTTYPAHAVIGDPFVLYGRRPGAWWRQLDWSQGMSLDSLAPFPGLSVRDQLEPVQISSEGVTGLHVRFPVQGPEDQVLRFWNHVETSADRSGKYINDALGLQVGETSQINPVDFYFDYLGHNILVFKFLPELEGATVKRLAVDFILEEKPLGCVPIVL